jgi:methionyl-tRNA formyltransferase
VDNAVDPIPLHHARIAVFVSPGWFSAAGLETFLANHLPIQQVVLAGAPPAGTPKPRIPVTQPRPLDPLAKVLAAKSMACHYVASPLALNDLSLPDCDYLITACFPYRLPAAVLKQAKTMALNIHPSLLPLYRGPDPVFWQLRNGETALGVSLHVMEEGLDAGPVLAQQVVSFESGATRRSLDEQLARAGARLLTDKTLGQKPQAQDEAMASYYSLPVAADYEVPCDWDVQRAYNFIRATVSSTYPHRIQSKNNVIEVHAVLAMQKGEILGVEFVCEADTIRIQFRSGVLLVQGRVSGNP